MDLGGPLVIQKKAKAIKKKEKERYWLYNISVINIFALVQN